MMTSSAGSLAVRPHSSGQEPQVQQHGSRGDSNSPTDKQIALRSLLVRVFILIVTAHSLHLVTQAQDLDPEPVAEWTWGLPAAVRDGLAYCGGDGFAIVDVQDPRRPRLVGDYDTDGGVEDLFLSGDHAFVRERRFDNTGGPHVGALTILDISDPTNPLLAGGYESDVVLTGRGSVSGNYVYLIGSRYEQEQEKSDVLVVDVSDPTNPHPVSSYDTVLAARAVASSGPYAYVAEGQYTEGSLHHGLVEVLDLSKPGDPHPVGRYETVGIPNEIIVAGQYAYVAASAPNPVPGEEEALLVLDMAEAAEPHKIGGLTAQETGFARSISLSVSGKHALLMRTDEGNPGGPAGGLVIDISNPANLTRVSAFTIPSRRRGVISGDYAFLMDQVFVLNPLPTLRFEPTEIGSAIQWKRGALQFSPSVNGPWIDLPAASPFPLAPIGDKGFFRVKAE